MERIYLTKEQIALLSAMAFSIMPQSDVRKLASLGRKYGLSFTHARLANLQLWWDLIVNKLLNLPATDKFRKGLEADGKWKGCTSDPKIIIQFIKHLGLFDSEYMFLCNLKLEALTDFGTSTFHSYGLPTVGIPDLLAIDGEYYTYFEQFSRSNCDPAALAYGKSLKNTLDTLLKGKTATERHGIATVIAQYAASDNMPESEFHNLIFKNQ